MLAAACSVCGVAMYSRIFPFILVSTIALAEVEPAWTSGQLVTTWDVEKEITGGVVFSDSKGC